MYSLEGYPLFKVTNSNTVSFNSFQHPEKEVTEIINSMTTRSYEFDIIQLPEVITNITKIINISLTESFLVIGK